VVQGAQPTKTAIHTELPGLRALLFERRPPEELMREGLIALRGDVARVEAFVLAVQR
jgi:hypothetical protein